MAFIRWKHNTGGNRQAYLIQSYRGEDGKPRHRMLAYLGNTGRLTPERITDLKMKYADLKVDWEKINPVDRPLTDITRLSDADLLHQARRLRHERGLTQHKMVWNLQKNGLPPCSGTSKGGLGGRDWGAVEKALEQGEAQVYYLDPLAEIAPALRRALI